MNLESCGFPHACEIQSQTSLERRSARYKSNLLGTTLTCGVLMLYFYWRHNEYCEPYVYSLFCVTEYVVVLANIGFHFTAWYELHRSDVVVTHPLLAAAAASLGGGSGDYYLPLLADKPPAQLA